MIALFFLAACTTATQTSTVPFDDEPLVPVEDTDTDHDTDQGSDSGGEDSAVTSSSVLHVRSAEYGCGAGDYLDLDLSIPIGSVAQTYLLVNDASGPVWLLASGGVLVWDENGADLACTWSPGPVGSELFWSGLPATVSGVRVVWIAG